MTGQKAFIVEQPLGPGLSVQFNTKPSSRSELLLILNRSKRINAMNRTQCHAFWLACLLSLNFGGCGSQPDGVPSAAMPRIPSPDLPGAPLIPRLAVLRPYCETKFGSIDAGSAAATAFVLQPSGLPPVVLTVMSLLTPANGLSKEVESGQQSRAVTGVTLGSAFGEMDSVITAAGVLDTHVSQTGDLLAIILPANAQERVGKLIPAQEQPAVGTRVFLSAALFAGAPPSQRQHSAIITDIDALGRLVYKFDNPEISMEGTSGAPLLNATGEVVAIHITVEDWQCDGGVRQSHRYVARSLANCTQAIKLQYLEGYSALAKRSLSTDKKFNDTKIFVTQYFVW